ncbi:integration host factor subunit beta [bacterium]|jgi:nucleoid DNA-binding protein|nr:integration host factor subunit beta [bacterium]MBT4292328.1 integration host factor subunit beta [bacterium]
MFIVVDFSLANSRQKWETFQFLLPIQKYLLTYIKLTSYNATHFQEQPLTKAELVELIAKDSGVNNNDTAAIVNQIIQNISNALVSGDKVDLRGFGSFKVKTMAARNARNPKTGAKVKVPAKKVPFFKCSNELINQVNKAGR